MKETSPVAEKHQSLWLLVFSPVIWALHFLLSYITAAIWCEKMADPEQGLGPVRAAIWVYTILALAGILVVGLQGYKKYSFGNGMLPHDEDTPEDRHRFLGYATLLLSGLSLVGTVFAAFVLAFFWNCH